MTGMRLAAVTAVAAIVLGGCLSSGHQISRTELLRLSQTPPAERGARVEVVQQLGDDPPPAQGVTGQTEIVYVTDPIVIVGSDHHHGHHGPRGGGHVGGKGSGGSGKDAAIAAVVIAVTAVVALAVTEGRRFAGGVQLHPMHPVHLWGPWGHGVLPLAHIDPATAAATTRAQVSDREGPWLRLDRAPLDRLGMTYSVLGGAGQLRGDDGRKLGPSFHVQLGAYPGQRWGLVVDWTAAWRDTSTGHDILDLRWGLELQLLPLSAGKLHAGGFVNGAYAWRSEADQDESALVSGGGALVQLDLSTYLALTGRVGIMRAWGEYQRDVTIGLSIY